MRPPAEPESASGRALMIVRSLGEAEDVGAMLHVLVYLYSGVCAVRPSGLPNTRVYVANREEVVADGRGKGGQRHEETRRQNAGRQRRLLIKASRVADTVHGGGGLGGGRRGGALHGVQRAARMRPAAAKRRHDAAASQAAMRGLPRRAAGMERVFAWKLWPGAVENPQELTN